MRFKGEHIWIIGASSGIGESLAHHLASEGAKLILSARREDKLNALNTSLGNKHHVMALDVADTDALASVVQKAAGLVPAIDRVIFLSAIYDPASIRKMDIGFAAQTMQTNIVGAMALTKALLPIFDKQHTAQLVLCASVAAYTGLPYGQPYSASKAALLGAFDVEVTFRVALAELP